MPKQSVSSNETENHRGKEKREATHLSTGILEPLQGGCLNLLFALTHRQLGETLLTFQGTFLATLCFAKQNYPPLRFWERPFNFNCCNWQESPSLWKFITEKFLFLSTWRFILLPYNYAGEEINELWGFSSKLGSITSVFFERALRCLEPLYIIQYLLRLALVFYELWTDHKCTG